VVDPDLTYPGLDFQHAGQPADETLPGEENPAGIDGQPKAICGVGENPAPAGWATASRASRTMWASFRTIMLRQILARSAPPWSVGLSLLLLPLAWISDQGSQTN
jgi:hypothetical protein